MTEHEPQEPQRTSEDELRVRLGAVDPAASLAPADPHRITRLLEDTMSETATPGTGTPIPSGRGSGGPNRLTWLLGAAAVAVVAIIAVTVVVRGTGPDETAAPPMAVPSTSVLTKLALPQAVDGRCAVPTAALLATKDLAFAGTVASITGDTVTFTPTEFYAGTPTEQVTVQQPSADLVKVVSAPRFAVGSSYLVSASHGVLSVCGSSGPTTPALQALYDSAFPS